MGEFTITAGTTASPRTRTKTIADADFPGRVIPALKAYYGPTRDTDVGPWRDRTNNELLDAIFDDLAGVFRRIVRDGESKTAVQSVTDIIP